MSKLPNIYVRIFESRGEVYADAKTTPWSGGSVGDVHDYTPTARLRDLVEKWRKQKIEFPGTKFAMAAGDCAAELEALLAEGEKMIVWEDNKAPVHKPKLALTEGEG